MHKRLVAHILLLAVMFMVAAFSGNVTAASGTYNDPLGRFSVGIPTGWILNRTYPDGFTVLFAKGTERFEIQTAEMTQTDPIAKAKMFFGANSPTVFNTGADGLLYTAYSESGLAGGRKSAAIGHCQCDPQLPHESEQLVYRENLRR